MRVAATINGLPYESDDVWALESLLTFLRERVGLRGTKNACEQGECGSCTVELDGELVCACLVAAGQADGSEIVTIEGLGGGDVDLGPVQQAFLEAGAVQCGFCTPGMILTVKALLDSPVQLTPEEARQAISGNLCRCTGYQKILDGVLKAAEERRPERESERD